MKENYMLHTQIKEKETIIDIYKDQNDSLAAKEEKAKIQIESLYVQIVKFSQKERTYLVTSIWLLVTLILFIVLQIW